MSAGWGLRLGAGAAFCLLLVVGAWLLFAANIKLFLKDGTYQLAREYKVEGDRVSFLSVDRDEWEEIPVVAGGSGKNSGRHQAA